MDKWNVAPFSARAADQLEVADGPKRNVKELGR